MRYTAIKIILPLIYGWNYSQLHLWIL